MQRQAILEEETLTPTNPSGPQQQESPARSAVTWLAGVASGTLGAAAMTTLARIQNPEMVIGQQNAWLLYALLGAITGFCAASGRRKAARVGIGMSLAIFLSPLLLELLCAFLRLPIPSAAQSPLVINACLPLGAFIFLQKWPTRKAAVYGGIAFFILDLVYNLLTVGAGGGLLLAVWISTVHGALLGGLLGFLRECGEALQPRRRS
jgi:hypothetical protein